MNEHTSQSDRGSHRQSVFERNPKKTLVTISLLGLIICDLLITNVLEFTGIHSPPHKIEQRYRTPHPVYHHTLEANVDSYDALFGPLRYSVSSNSLGFKDRAPREITLAAEHKRIIFIGDSFTEGIGIEYPDTFVGIMDDRLSGDGIEVLTAGVNSYSPIIYRRKIEYLVDQGLTFDHLVVLIDLSDAHDEVFRYKLDENQNVADIDPHGPIYALREWLTNNSSFYAYTRLWVRQFNHRKKAELLARQGGMSIHRQLANWTLNDDLYEKWGRKGLESATVHMDMLHQLSIEKQFELSIVVYPWPNQIWHRDLDSRQVSHWRNWSEDRGLRFVNLFPLFINEHKSSEEFIKQLFIKGDVHWNNEGHALIADTLIESLDIKDKPD